MTERHACAEAYVRRRFDDVVRLMDMHAGRTLVGRPAAAPADAQMAGADVATIQVRVGGFDLRRDVRIQREDFTSGEHRARLALRWEAVEDRAWFPVMRALVEFEELATDPAPVTLLSFVGSYRPPLGRFGAAADAVLGHRIATAVARQFVSGLGQRIEAELSAGGVGRYLGRNRGAGAPP